jgi:hypothetical protein
MSSAKSERSRAHRFVAVSERADVSRTSRRWPGSANPAKRSRFLRLGSDALSRVYGTEGIYACPLCFTNFSISEFEKFDAERSDELTLEHVPQKRVGGREILLTCKKCNNDFKADGALARFEDQLDYWQEVPGVRMNNSTGITHTGMRIRVESRIDDSGLHEVVAVGPPVEVEAFEAMAEENGGFAVAHPVVPFDTDVALGYLKSAYLAAFAKLGYSWAGCSKVTPIRHRLNGRDPFGINPLAIVLAQPGGSHRRLLKMSSPFKALVVQWDFVAVVLPFHETPDDYAEILRQSMGTGKTASFEFDGNMMFPQSLELRWDLHNLKNPGPFLGWSECEEHGHHVNIVEACEVLASRRTANLVRIQSAPFRAQQLIDGPEGLFMVLSDDDYAKYASTETIGQ